jgi:4-oxalocrotonate tautomerase family enzyme
MKHRVIAEVAQACADALEIPVERIHVALHEMSSDNYGVGGIPTALKG